MLMSEPSVSIGARLAMAWRVIVDAVFAKQCATQLNNTATVAATPPATLRETKPEAALQLLGLLQQQGRLVDFLQEDINGFSDSDIGNAARVVHEGCRKVLQDYLQIEPISEQEEGQRLTLQAGFDAASYRLTGNVVGQAPFTGTLAHRGWRVSRITLPKVASERDNTVLAPAELEL